MASKQKEKQKKNREENQKKTLKLVNLKPEVYSRLCKAKGFIQMHVGDDITFSDAVDAVLGVFEAYQKAVLEKEVEYGEVEKWADMVAEEMRNEQGEPEGEKV